jgi:hypothetical protein
VDVAAGQRIWTDPVIVGTDELFPDLRAGGVARFGGARQPHSCPYQQRFDRRDRDPEARRELLVGHAVKLTHEQRGPLLVRKSPDVGD